jgi:hypothetical protein
MPKILKFWAFILIVTKETRKGGFSCPSSKDARGDVIYQPRWVTDNVQIYTSRLMQDLRKSMTGRYLAIGKRIIISARIRKRQYFQSPRNDSPGLRSWRSWQAKKPIIKQQRSLTGYPDFPTSQEKVSRLITALRIMAIVSSQTSFPSRFTSPIPIRPGKKERLRTQIIVFAGTFPGGRCWPISARRELEKLRNGSIPLRASA